MLMQKTSILLNAIVISFLIGGSHTTLAKVSDIWEKRGAQVTEAEKASDKAKEERKAEMDKAIAERNKEESIPEKKSEETVKSEAVKLMPAPKPAHKPGTLAGKAVKPLLWQERARLAKEKREAAMNGAKAQTKEGINPPMKEEHSVTTLSMPAPIVGEPKVEHEHIVTTLPMPKPKVADNPSKEVVHTEETLTLPSTPPPPPAMSATQKRLMAEQK